MSVIVAVSSAIVVSVLIVSLSIPLVLGRVKPNMLYGFRTAKTLSDPVIWYAANRLAGKALLIVGLVALSLSLALLALLHRKAVSPLAEVGALLLVFVPLTVAVVISFRHLKRL